MGIDPGLTRCGYAVLRWGSAQDVKVLALGVIRTSPHDALATRLAEIHLEVDSLLSQYRPGALAAEQVFFQTNVRTAMSVGQASGVVLALAARRGCEVSQYSPSQVKSTVAGWGSADKDQVGRMVVQRLGLSAIPTPADIADAAAVALCHCSLAPFVARRAAAISANGGAA